MPVLPHHATPIRTAAAVASAMLLATSCGEPAADFYVHGTGVVVRTSAPFARQPDLPGRVEGAVAAALQYWGGDWGQLSGSRLTLLDGPYVPCGAAGAAVGCYDGDFTISASDPGAGVFRCIEQTALVHEVGHAIIGDPLHTDARWMDFEAVGAALAGRSGYTADGDGDCDIALSVWRHPPDTP